MPARLLRLLRPSRLSPRARVLALAGLVVAIPLALLAARALALLAIEGGLRHAAAGRGATAAWRSVRFVSPLRVRIVGLTLTRRSDGEPMLRADSITVAADPWSFLTLTPRPARVEIAHARIAAPAPPPSADSLAEEAPAQGRVAAERVRRTAATVVRLLMAPARRLPELSLRDLAVESAPEEPGAPPEPVLAVDHLDLARDRDGIRLEGAGRVALEQRVPFDLTLEYGSDDHLGGRAWFGVPDSAHGRMDSLIVRIDGTLSQNRRRGELVLGDGSLVRIGRLPFTVGARIERHGPRASLHLAADGLTESLIERSIPAPLLGPLTQVAVEGSFDYRLDLDLDVARPDSVALAVRVLPHGLAINADGTELPILGLDEPFTALIHLPRGRTAVRELSRDNPFYRPLEDIDTTLAYAVVTNEDGAFFRHRGFNLEAVRGSIAENLRAGAYRRGAGTITMQLVRNLYLGHQRTLSRKAQEVVLAWLIEHLTGLSKQRILEIYLNIVEWGPGVHGIGEAAHYYFDRDPARLTTAQSLFLATLLPAPTKWRYRLDRAGALRASTRAQMRFIGRAMVGKGWLDPAALPAADSLVVEITGPAREELEPGGAPGADRAPA
ncbi:MAG TPA: biosynthetic peptidoglycan transglycosylase, partial [Candidatus Eisenbacteria bacterium]